MSWELLKFEDLPPEGIKVIGIKMPEPEPITEGMPCAADASLPPGAFVVMLGTVFVAPDIFERLLACENVRLR